MAASRSKVAPDASRIAADSALCPLLRRVWQRSATGEGDFLNLVSQVRILPRALLAYGPCRRGLGELNPGGDERPIR
jgi:hypothetical protein